MTIRTYARVVALAGATAALIAAALALWLSAAPPSVADTKTQDQGTTVTVTANAISWGSAGDCVQSMGTADWGARLPGAFVGIGGFRGCVSSNANGWAVSAAATDLTNAADTISKGNLRVIAGGSGLSGSAVGASVPCGAACSLATPQTVLSGGSVGTGGFEYGFDLAVPDTTPSGVYTGAVTFTASN